jgi:hypothetical protein
MRGRTKVRRSNAKAYEQDETNTRRGNEERDDAVTIECTLTLAKTITKGIKRNADW